MPQVRRLLLDILKPHQPNALEFARRLAQEGSERIKVTVLEVDDRTETLQVEVVGDDISFEQIETAITDMGASLHSIDEVEVSGH